MASCDQTTKKPLYLESQAKHPSNAVEHTGLTLRLSYADSDTPHSFPWHRERAGPPRKRAWRRTPTAWQPHGCGYQLQPHSLPQPQKCPTMPQNAPKCPMEAPGHIKLLAFTHGSQGLAGGPGVGPGCRGPQLECTRRLSSCSVLANVTTLGCVQACVCTRVPARMCVEIRWQKLRGR